MHLQFHSTHEDVQQTTMQLQFHSTHEDVQQDTMQLQFHSKKCLTLNLNQEL
jgi:hypothetical protein